MKKNAAKPVINERKPFIYSILGHAILLSLLFLNNQKGNGKGDGDGPENAQDARHKHSDQDQDIVPKEMEQSEPKAIQVTLIEKPKAQPVKREVPKQENTVTECAMDLWFGGIGVTLGYASNGDIIIDTVHPGYPAWKSDLRAGDILLNQSEIRGVPGTVLNLKYRRGNTINTIDIVREKICVAEKP